MNSDQGDKDPNSQKISILSHHDESYRTSARVANPTAVGSQLVANDAEWNGAGFAIGLAFDQRDEHHCADVMRLSGYSIVLKSVSGIAMEALRTFLVVYPLTYHVFHFNFRLWTH